MYLATWDICVNDILCEDPGTEDFLVQTKENFMFNLVVTFTSNIL